MLKKIANICIRKNKLQLLAVFVFLLSLSLLNPSNGRAAKKIYFIHQDHLSSTSLVTDENGDIVAQNVYYPYGSSRNTSGDLPTEKKYTEQVSDEKQTGLYYYNARYFNPQVGLFTQADTQEGLNRYFYASNNPVVFIDPEGTDGHCVVQERNEDSYITRLDEPVNIVQERERIMRAYNITIGSVKQRTPYYYYYDYASVLEPDFWTTGQLNVLENSLKRLSPDIYAGSSVFSITNTLVNGYSGGSVHVDQMAFSETLFIHEFAHVQQFAYPELFQDFILLAQKAGFREITGEDRKNPDLMDYLSPNDKHPPGLIFNNITDPNVLSNYHFYNEFGGYAMVNYYELGAMLSEYVGGYFGTEAQEYYKQNFPELYDYIWLEIYRIDNNKKLKYVPE